MTTTATTATTTARWPAVLKGNDGTTARPHIYISCCRRSRDLENNNGINDGKHRPAGKAPPLAWAWPPRRPVQVFDALAVMVKPDTLSTSPVPFDVRYRHDADQVVPEAQGTNNPAVAHNPLTGAMFERRVSFLSPSVRGLRVLQRTDDESRAYIGSVEKSPVGARGGGV